MAARRDHQERLNELRAAISADLTELGRRWRDAQREVAGRRRNFRAAAQAALSLLPTKRRPVDRRDGQ